MVGNKGRFGDVGWCSKARPDFKKDEEFHPCDAWGVFRLFSHLDLVPEVEEIIKEADVVIPSVWFE